MYFGYKDHSLKEPAVHKGRFFLDKILFYPTHDIFAGFKKVVIGYKDQC